MRYSLMNPAATWRWMRLPQAAGIGAAMLLVMACIGVQQRAAQQVLLLEVPRGPVLVEAEHSGWPLAVGRMAVQTAANVLWPHRRLIPRVAKTQKSGLALLNPGELAGELKDPDDPWGYSHPRCRGLPTCSSSTSSPAVTRHQQEMQHFHSAVMGRAVGKLQGLRVLNPGELAGELKDPDDPFGYSHPRCRGLPTCSDSTSSPAVTRQTFHEQKAARAIKLTPREHSALTHLETDLSRARARQKQALRVLNPGELAGELKDPDDPWGYSHPRCRGLPTCSDSTASPAVKRHQAGLVKTQMTARSHKKQTSKPLRAHPAHRRGQ